MINIRGKLVVITFYLIFLSIFLVVIFGCLKVYDFIILKNNPQPSIVLGWGLTENTNVFQFDLYPYDGFHLQSDSSYGSIKTGDHGFFIDFDLENPPEKKENEFRIILIGGSAAQGWWGKDNDDMFYRRIEKSLNDTLRDMNITLRVINLAMSATITYQNYIALNKWGHELRPDLILSVSGVNDFLVGGYYDVPYSFKYAMGLVNMTKHSYSPDLLKLFARIFPGIYSHSEIGNAIRIFNFSKYTNDALVKYYNSHHNSNKFGYNLYIHSLKSIKRDFDGIPMFIVSQPFDYSSYLTIAESYDSLIENVSKDLSEYYNSDWFFLDIHNYWKENGLYNKDKPLLADFAHMTSEGHISVSEMLTKELINIISELVNRTKENSK